MGIILYSVKTSKFAKAQNCIRPYRSINSQKGSKNPRSLLRVTVSETEITDACAFS